MSTPYRFAPPRLPPLIPTSESDVLDEAFSDLCRLIWMKTAALETRTLTFEKTTLSPKWGLVFRADFINSPGPAFGLVNRVVCWRRKNGRLGVIEAFGQDIPPLSI